MPGAQASLAPLALVFLLLSASCSAGGETGISWEEYRRNFPPPPRGLAIAGTGDARILLWDLPDIAPATETLAYDPVIVGFKVYAVAADGGQSFLAETRGTYYPLARRAAGTPVRYAVTALQRSGHESEPSPEIEDESDRK